MYLKNEIGAEERKQDEDWIWGVMETMSIKTSYTCAFTLSCITPHTTWYQWEKTLFILNWCNFSVFNSGDHSPQVSSSTAKALNIFHMRVDYQSSTFKPGSFSWKLEICSTQLSIYICFVQKHFKLSFKKKKSYLSEIHTEIVREEMIQHLGFASKSSSGDRK